MPPDSLLLILWCAAFAGLWIPEERPRNALVFGIAGAALLLGLAEHHLAPYAPLWAVALFVTGYKALYGNWRTPARWALIVLALALGFGLLPGFSPVHLGEALAVKPGSTPYTLGFRIDKALAGLALLAVLVPLGRSTPDWRRVGVATTKVVAGLVPLMFAFGLLTGYVGFAPGAPSVGWFFTWSAINLLLVAAVEEAFFRGVVQRELSPRIGPTGALAVAGLLFGLAHFGGGGHYVVLATLAGLGYGLAYQLSGQRIEAAILTHFGVNAIHLLLFTYPRAVVTG